MSTGIFYEGVDGIRREYTVESLAALKQATPDEILTFAKDATRQRIKSIYETKRAALFPPEDDVITLGAAVEMLDRKSRRGGNLAAPETAFLDGLVAKFARVTALRAYRDQLYTTVGASADPASVDVDAGWPE